MSIPEKKRVENHADRVITELATVADKALQESNVSDLKRCFDRAVEQVTSLSQAFDAMIRVIATEGGSKPNFLKESDSCVNAMKEVSIAAIDLAKSVATDKKDK